MAIDIESLFDLPPKRRPQDPRIARARRLWLFALALFGLFIGLRLLLGLVIDSLWFASLGQAAAFRTRLLAPLAVFGSVLAVGGLWLGAHWSWAARSLARPGNPARGLRRLAALAAVLAAGAIGLGSAAGWQTLLLYAARQPFGQTEAVLGRDLGLYVFQLPAWRWAHGVAAALVLAALAGAAVIHLLGGAVEARGRLKSARTLRGRLRGLGGAKLEAGQAARRHLALLGAAYALILAAGSWLARYEFVAGSKGRVDGILAGPGYTDVHLRLPVMLLMAGLWVLVALLFAIGAFRGRLGPAWLAVAAMLALRLVGGELVPGLVQRYRVKPNELSFERPYLEQGIAHTRRAWGLDGIQELDYEPLAHVTKDLVRSHGATIDNVRLWDWRVLLDFLKQKQAIRPYYDFWDVDIDRYAGPDGPRQVELAARELQPAGLRNPTWISRHLEYTHGYGLALLPVDEADARGQPVLWARDLPLRQSPELASEILQPRIYFGEAGGELPYVITGSRPQEFDYPVGAENARTVYDGQDGLALGSPWRRLIMALYFGDLEILLSDDIEPDSRLLMVRHVAERAERLAPFLTFDPDPYLVVTSEGRLVWIIDAYTATDHHPYSQTVRLPQDAGGEVVNYLRNSVKVVIDAYDGRPTFYVVSPDDPLIRAWQEVFPGLFRPAEEAPADLVAHWRYPETLFVAQTRIFERYHVSRPEVFYNGEDVWSLPMETRSQGATEPMEPYYVTMSLRGEEKPEFVLMRPFVPAGKKNMIAWLAARSDPGAYGQLVLYNFGKGQQVDGPEQVEGRIDNSTEISSQLTLWSQAGSRTIRGHLLVIPLGDALLYVEPLYLQAESNALPELKRVIVADGERVAMRETFAEALAVLTADVAAPASPAPVAADRPPPTPGPRPTAPAAVDALPADAAGLVAAARAAEAEAGEALERGDWIGFGAAMDRLSRALDALGGLAGSATDVAVP